jgi:predicted acylesterase/phospholipase RssA
MATVIDLVFSGGGTRGVALGGALEVLEQRRPVIRRCLGTSAGAIAAAFGAAGLTGREYLKLVPAKEGDEFLFNSFFAPPPGDVVRDSARKKDSDTRKLLRGAADGMMDKMLQGLVEKRPRIGELIKGAIASNKDKFYENAFEGFLERSANHENPDKPRPRTAFFAMVEFGGLFDPGLFRVWLVEQLKKRVPDINQKTTLKQFHEMARQTGRELSVVVSDTSAAKALVLNHRTAPDCPIVEAVLMSMSVPLVWPETQWPKEWGMYLGRDVEGHYMVDGGLLSNFPIHYLTHRDQDEMKLIFGEPEPANERPAVIGLLLDGGLAVPGDVNTVADKPEFKLFERIGRMFDTLSAWQADIYREADAMICHIGVKGHPALETQRNAEVILRLQALVNSGRCAMTDYLKKRKLF